MTPYPVIDVKATGENILRRRIEKGCTVLDVQRYLNLACPQSCLLYTSDAADEL